MEHIPDINLNNFKKDITDETTLNLDVEILYVKKLYTDKEIKKLEGNWIDESYIKYPVLNKNTDVYWIDDNDKKHLLIKFRKNVISDKLIKIGWDNYKDLAKASRGRAAAAGPIDKNNTYWAKRNLINTSKWSTSYLNPTGNKLKEKYDKMSLDELILISKKYNIKEADKEKLIIDIIKKEKGISKMKVNNQVASNPIGYIEEMKNMNKLPCRLTHFTRTNFDKYNSGIPFIQRINFLYKKLVPDKYKKQYDRASLKSNLQIKSINEPEIINYYDNKKEYDIKDYYYNNATSFSTITINRNFRTALHKDGGDFKEGFGNLTVIERGKYKGGYTILPQFGVAIDVRINDFLAFDVHQWHANSKLYADKFDENYNKTIPKIFKDNKNVGTIGIYEDYTRLTFVCYLREKIIKCNNIDNRFLNKSCNKKII